MVKYELCICILNYKSSEETISLYSSLKNYGIKTFKLLVIDNFSNNEEVIKLQAIISKDDLRLLPDNKGYAKGNSIAINEAIAQKIPYVLLLNPDIRLTKECILVLMDTIKCKDDFAVVGPRICFRDKPNIIYSDGGFVDKGQGFYTYHLNHNKKVGEVTPKDNEYMVDYVNGSVFIPYCYF
ncbi:glycosyltransferase [Thalassobellus suaedae]|uniref:Glycosyltransferase n=1 Tax=Thalassobellus suaedae TaxID=3074124 RepID=A0ABY9XUJ5_9FLAO|nr:glycosyltransferase [Flavobacteriaceae bacterium HL-DH14]